MNYDVSTLLIGLIAIVLFIDKIASWVVNVDRAKDVIDKHNPTTDIKARLDKHDELLERDRLHLLEHDKDIKKLGDDMQDLIKKIGENNRIMLECLFTLLDSASGDINKEEVREAKQKLQDHLLK